MSACFAAAGLTLLGSLSAVRAAAPALNGSLTLRPLTPTEITTYGLTGSNAQISAGIRTVGLGEPVYIDAMVNAAIAPSNIVGVTWSLVASNKPAGSAATLSDGPLGTNVPLYKVADRYNNSGAAVFQLAGRTFFRPDAVGPYTVNATITTVGSGSTNLSATITAATYLGLQTCSSCHSGGTTINGVTVPDVYHDYSNTLHAAFFKRSIDGLESSYFSKSYLPASTLGYDTNAVANNNGFDDIALLYGWNFPNVLTNGNWDAMPSAVQNLANIQCENCHGPGSQHFFSQGTVGNPNAIAVSYVAGNCAQCHDSNPQEQWGIKVSEWNNSLHAHPTRTPSGSTSRINCVRCHTAPGFRDFIANSVSTNNASGYVTNVVYEAITCAACHDPHDASNPHQLRAANSYTLPEGTTVTNVGLGALCMNCHHSRNGSATNNILNYQQSKPTWANGSSFGVHDSTAGDMVEGVNAITYGKVIPSGSHSAVIPDVCVGCHMQPVASTNPAYGQAGGHTYSMTYKVVNAGVTNTADLVDVCVKCHGPIEEFNFARKDYNGDGIIEGVQTEVQHLLDKLSTLLPNSTYQANASNYVADGLVKTSVSTKTNWPTKFLNAAWNWQFVNVEGSKGVHNAPYAVGVLKASIGDLTGDDNNDGLPDSWQIAYFGAGFATNAAAGPNALNNTAGVPNWMMCSLNLNPFGAFTVAGSGAIYINDGNVVNGATNTIAIYTAAEIAFDTVPGTSYQIQGISQLTDSWQNISTNIPGTGSTISYLTPTHGVQQMFYRVVHTP
ncbi:MAG: hypothetical protein PHY43_02840 [Verrucomicrobiales bacterium]|nr:hypothetical protein [Verrucomicrobiales bacterium]